MDEVKKCGKTEALKMLQKGAFVFTEIRHNVVEEKRGCRKCHTKMEGNFCSKCGNKLTDKLKVVVGQEFTEFRLQYIGGELYAETRTDKNSFFSGRQKCKFSLEFFLNQEKWSWIW